MKVFTIENETNNIMVHGSVQEAEAMANADRFRNEAGLAKLSADWPTARLVEIWNSLPGVTPVSKFKDRATAASRIWKAIQSLTVGHFTENIEPTDADHDEILAEIVAAPETAAEPESNAAATTETPFDGEPAATQDAPQTPDVAPTGAPTTKKTTRTKTTRTKTTRTKTTPTQPIAAKAPREASKTSQVIAMLKRDGGTTLEEIMTAMGWLKHTTRAMLSAGGSLTKKHGLVIVSEKVGDKRRYSIKG